MVIARYTPDFRDRWNDFAARSRCPSFLFRRDYMEYHSDRFADCSLLAFNTRGRLLAMLPAEISGDTVSSHRGLSYGGWITPRRHFNGTTMLELFEAATEHLRAAGVKRLVYSPQPHIYTGVPSDEDVYALFRLGAAQTSCVLSSAINLRNPNPWNESTRQALKLAVTSGVEVHESADYPAYWEILSNRLETRHGTRPVHSLDEITRLATLFHDNIRLYTATIDGETAAGAVIYFCGRTAKIQYMATTEKGRDTKALAAVIDHVLSLCRPSFDYLDMGGSTEKGGSVLNSGLLLQKSGFGASGVAYHTYTLSL